MYKAKLCLLIFKSWPISFKNNNFTFDCTYLLYLADCVLEETELLSDSNMFKNPENIGNSVALPEIPGNNPVRHPEIHGNNPVQNPEIHEKNPVQTPETNPVTDPEIHGKPVKRTIRRTAMRVTCL